MRHPPEVRRWRGPLQSLGDVFCFVADDGTFSSVRSTFWALTTLYREHRIMLSEILMEYDAWAATEGER